MQETKPGCELVNVEKRPGFQRVQQDDINQMMVERARKGLLVVRLKGGDPIVFGRGGEEAEMLRAENIPFEIVPGITSAIAAPAYAGIPVTHRGISTHLTIVTGTTAALEGHQEVDWEALAKVGGTLLIMMGTRKRAEIAQRLIGGGLLPETPIAAVQWGSLPVQKTVRTTLGQMAEVEMQNPSVIVVGEVASMDLSWFVSRPLFGRTIAVTRARAQASELVQLLGVLGAVVIEVPTIAFVEPADWNDVDCAIEELSSFDWLILTSSNGTDRFFERLFLQGHDMRALSGLRIATVGGATSARVRDWHLTVDLEARERVAEGLLKALGDEASKGRFLIPRPEKSRDVLAQGLRDLGGAVREVVVYKTIVPASFPFGFVTHLQNRTVDLVTFTSSSTVTNFVKLLEENCPEIAQKNLPAACIGPITAQTARDVEFDVVIELDEASVSIGGLVDAIEVYFK